MNPSIRTLCELHRGEFPANLDLAMAAVVDAVRSTGRKGGLTVKIEIGLASKGDDSTLKLSATAQ